MKDLFKPVKHIQKQYIMKVCLISEARSCHTQRWSRGLAAAGCDVHLISAENVNISDINLHVLPIYSTNPLAKVRNNYRIEKFIKNLNPDITHIFGLFSMFSLINMLLARKLKNPVISVWGSDVVSDDSHESVKDRCIKKYLLNKSKRITATSEYLEKKTSRYTNNNVRIDVLPWGVDLKIFRPKLKQKCAKTIVLGFAKKLQEYAGPDILIKAFKCAKKTCQKRLKLKIAGNGPMEDELKRVVKMEGLSNDVEWFGWLDKIEKLRDFYSSLDLFVMPSRKESYGVAAVEAAASGIPVIASDFGGIPEIIVDGKTGILVTPENVKEFAEAISILAENNEYRLKMGHAARKRAEKKFDWNESLNRMMEIYNQVINGL